MLIKRSGLRTGSARLGRPPDDGADPYYRRTPRRDCVNGTSSQRSVHPVSSTYELRLNCGNRSTLTSHSSLKSERGASPRPHDARPRLGAGSRPLSN
jgi:hypothetical protein